VISNKVFKMRSALRSIGVVVLLFCLIGCGAETPAPTLVEQPVTPPQDSGAGKDIKSRIPRQPGSQTQGK
jgi:predicted small lipoprotein YifL